MSNRELTPAEKKMLADLHDAEREYNELAKKLANNRVGLTSKEKMLMDIFDDLYGAKKIAEQFPGVYNGGQWIPYKDIKKWKKR